MIAARRAVTPGCSCDHHRLSPPSADKRRQVLHHEHPGDLPFTEVEHQGKLVAASIPQGSIVKLSFPHAIS